MSQVRLTRRALRHVDEIDRYSVATFGEDVAREYLAELESALSRIGEAPQLLRPRIEFSASLTFYRVRKHTLVCDIIADTIYVLAIWHGRMDFAERIQRLEPQFAQEVELLRGELE